MSFQRDRGEPKVTSFKHVLHCFCRFRLRLSTLTFGAANGVYQHYSSLFLSLQATFVNVKALNRTWRHTVLNFKSSRRFRLRLLTWTWNRNWRHSVLCSGQQIMSKIDSFQNANSLISQPNHMMLPLIEIVSERRFQWGSHHRVWIRNKKVIMETILFTLS